MNCCIVQASCAKFGGRKQYSILVSHKLQSRTLKDHVAFVPNSMLIKVLTQALSPRGASVAAQHNRQAVSAHPEKQQDTQCASRMHRALGGINRGPGRRKCCGLANQR